MVLGSGIRDPEKNTFRIPDPGVKKPPDPGSATLMNIKQKVAYLGGLIPASPVSSWLVTCDWLPSTGKFLPSPSAGVFFKIAKTAARLPGDKLCRKLVSLLSFLDFLSLLRR